jgi:CrcB protein
VERLLYIGCGGALGTLLRYGVSISVARLTGGTFPWGTMCVNLIGAFIIGFLSALFEITAVSPNLKSFALIGILGGFTTFSSYTLETVNLLRDGELRLALSNILVSNIAGIVLVLLGIVAFRYLLLLYR